MFKQFAIAFAATGMMVSAGSAIAAAKDEAPMPLAAPKPAAEVKTRYCLKSATITGTMIERRVCKTLDQWRAEGVDPTKKN